MKIVGKAQVEMPATSAAKPASGAGAGATPGQARGQSQAAPLQSAVLQPALTALRDMQEIDQAKVDQLREALARGEISFNATRLAALIQRYHGGRE